MRLRCHLRDRRVELGLHLREMQERTGIHRGTLSQIENGRRLPRDREIPIIDACYGIAVRDWYSHPHVLSVEFESDAP